MKLCGYNEKCYVNNIFPFDIDCDNLNKYYSKIFISSSPVCKCGINNEKVKTYNNEDEYIIILSDLRQKKLDSLY